MNRITTIREALGFSKQRPFARALGVNASYVNRLESDKQEISRSFIDRLCGAFPQVNREYLIHGVGEPLQQAAEPDIEIAMRVIADRVKRLDPDLQSEIYELCARILAISKEPKQK